MISVSGARTLTFAFVLCPLAAQAQNTLLTSGVAASFSYPQTSSPTLYAAERGFRIVVPANPTRLEVRLEMPTGVQFAAGLKFNSDFQGSRFDADNGGIGNENPVVVTASSSPPLRQGTYYIGILVLTSPGPVTGRITVTVTTGSGTQTGNTLLTSGVSAPYSFPRITSPTLFSGDLGFRIVVPQGSTRLEVRLEIPSGVQFAVGLKFGSDFQGGRFDADNGAIGNENPVIVTASSTPPLRAGTYYIGIAILSAPGAVSGRITATLTSGGGPAISVPTSLDVGSAAVGESREAVLTVRNTGNAALRIDSFTLSRTEFRVASPSTPLDVAAGGQQAVTIRFQPTATGAVTATLTITSNDPARATVTVNLTGQGTGGPGVVVSRNSLTFTSTVGTNPPPQTFTIRNNGGGTLTYQLSSTQPWMSVSPATGSSTGAANTITVSIDAGGLASGTHTGQIRIVWNGQPNYVMNVSLTLETSAVPRVQITSAASWISGSALAPSSIAIAAGENLAAATESATPPLPSTMAGITVMIKDSSGVERAALLYSVSPRQIKFVVPEETSAGPAALSISAGGSTTAAGTFQVEPAVPGLFSAAGDGRGVALGTSIRITADGVETQEPLADCDDSAACTARAIDLGPESDRVLVVIAATGIRNAVNPMTARIDGEPAEITGISPDSAMPGLDLVRILIPRILAGSGDVEVTVSEGELASSNAVVVRIGGDPPASPPQITAVTPDSAATSTRLALRITGQFLTGATAIEITPAAGITVANIRPLRTSVTAEIVIASDAASGPRTIRVVTPNGASNELPFTISAAPAGDLLPLRTGMSWSYRVNFPAAVDLPYQPIVEQPAGLLCSNVFCGTRRWEGGQIEFQITVNESLAATQSFRATITDPGRVFYFARTDPVELRLRTVQNVDNFDLIGMPSTIRIVRPLARVPRPPGAQTQSVTVPAGTFPNCTRTTIVLNGDGISVRGVFTTEVLVAPGTGIVRAEMRDSTGRVLYTQELTRFSAP